MRYSILFEGSFLVSCWNGLGGSICTLCAICAAAVFTLNMFRSEHSAHSMIKCSIRYVSDLFCCAIHQAANARAHTPHITVQLCMV